MAKRKGYISWNPVKAVVKEILRKYHPGAVKAEIIWDHVKTELPDTQITKETIYGILYRMNKAGEIQRVSMGWYQLPGKAAEKKFTPDPAWQLVYKGGHKDAMSPTADLEKTMQVFLEELREAFLLIVEMMKEITGGRRDANS